MAPPLPPSLFVALSAALFASVWLDLLVHELGHLMCALAVTTTPVTLQIGRGRVRLKRRWGRLVLVMCADNRALALLMPVALIGMPPESKPSTRARIAIIVCGPLATALLALLSGAVIVLSHPSQLGLLSLRILACVCVADAIGNCIPFRPRRRFAAHEGIGSDGQQILRLLRPPRLAHPFLVRDNVVSRPDYQMWHRIVGDADRAGKTPLVLVHGGPGLTHDYLEPLELLAGSGRRVILYDQAGCGHSTAMENPSLYSISFFVDELDALRHALGLERFHLWGTGWGAAIAMEYALAHPHALCSLTVNGTGPSTADNLADLHDLLAEYAVDDDILPSLSTKTRRLLRDYRDASPNTDASYQAALLQLLQKHFCRLDPWPPCLLAAFRQFGQDMCRALVGPNGIYPSGPLTEWDVRDRLMHLNLPVLVTGGAYDDVAPESIEDMAAAIPGALWCLFPNSSATPFLEEPVRYRRVLADFLDKVEVGHESCRNQTTPSASADSIA